MRFRRLEIINFKAVQRLAVEELGDVVVLAGPNGCGKSSVFDAIRLWKSAHGGYQQNEVHHWFNEFQLGIGNAGLLSVMSDPSRPMSITIDVELAEAERIWLRDFHDLLERARLAGAVPARVFSITDRDFDLETGESQGQVLHWDRFHIENYLLEPKFILKVMKDIRVPAATGMTEEEVEAALRESAERTLGSLLRHFIETFANARLIEGIRTRSNPHEADAAEALRQVIEASLARVQEAADNTLALPEIRRLEQEERGRLQLALTNGSWRYTFKGRDTLKRFVDDQLRGVISYPVFRDLIVASMRDAAYQPEGMRAILDRIVAA